nr:MAG TPA_asm: hypothetical protein [Caudoviricetes sp.]
MTSETLCVIFIVPYLPAGMAELKQVGSIVIRVIELGKSLISVRVYLRTLCYSQFWTKHVDLVLSDLIRFSHFM